MFGMSLVDKFKNLDVYRKLPKDIAQPTYSGAMRKKILTQSFTNKYRYHVFPSIQRIYHLYKDKDKQ
jgi:hypothetical protein